MLKMNWRRILACACLAALCVAVASSQTPAGLTGTWNVESMSALTNGQRSGTAHFKPGQWILRLNADATWVMRLSASHGDSERAGTYEVGGHDLTLKPTAGPDLKYRFSLKQAGKALTLTKTDKTSIITANRAD